MFATKRSTFIRNFFLRKLATKKASTVIKVPERLKNLRLSFEKDEINGDVVPIFKRSLIHSELTAIKEPSTEYSYQQIYCAAKKLSTQISNICGSGASLNVAVLCENDALLPLTQWGCWMSGQICVPLSNKLSYEKLNYIIRDSKAKLIISASHHEIMANNFADIFDIPVIVLDHNFIPGPDSTLNFLEKNLLATGGNVVVEGTLSNDFYTSSVAMIVYNVDRSLKPKGCVITYKNLQCRINIITKAWDYTQNDYILNLLPLEDSTHSVHSMMCPLNVGGKVSFFGDRDYDRIWNRMFDLNENVPTKDKPNILTALPSTYIKLIREYEKKIAKDSRMSEYIKSYCTQNFRLMISGPQPVPMNIFNYWNKITGHKLLRYYEMPETGSIISNPYMEDKQRKRNHNSVGFQLPQTNIRVVNTEGEILVENIYENNNLNGMEVQKYSPNLSTNCKGEALIGELQVSGSAVFQGYLNEERQKYFENNFFKTRVIVTLENSIFELLGDIDDEVIKNAGRCLSCSDIEIFLRSHPNIKDSVVISVPHTLWSEKICALCVVEPDVVLDLKNIKEFCSNWLPSYMCPDLIQIVPHINRDSVGKIDKNELKNQYFL